MVSFVIVEESDPRHKPGASLLDALGLVKRRTVTPSKFIFKLSHF
jgi:hypothetical protein